MQAGQPGAGRIRRGSRSSRWTGDTCRMTRRCPDMTASARQPARQPSPAQPSQAARQPINPLHSQPASQAPTHPASHAAGPLTHQELGVRQHQPRLPQVPFQPQLKDVTRDGVLGLVPPLHQRRGGIRLPPHGAPLAGPHEQLQAQGQAQGHVHVDGGAAVVREARMGNVGPDGPWQAAADRRTGV